MILVTSVNSLGIYLAKVTKKECKNTHKNEIIIHKYEVVTWFVYKIQSFKFEPTTFTKKVTVLINACQHS
jgi:hypothetical protein